MMIQDSIRELVLPRIERLVAKAVVLGTSSGKVLVNEKGVAMSISEAQIAFKLKLKYSYSDECASELSQFPSLGSRYPLLWINAKGVKYEGEIVTIPEMILATWTKEGYKAADRDYKTFYPILTILSEMLDVTFRDLYGVESGFKLKSEVVYNGLNPKLNAPDKVDAVLFTNTKLRILKNCKQ